MKVKSLKEKISITVDGDLLERAKHWAEQDDRSLSQFINLALREYLKGFPDEKQQHSETNENK